MSMLLDKEITNGLMKVTGAILKEHFFFDDEALSRFYYTYAEIVNTEYLELITKSDEEFKKIMINDNHLKKEFTATFCGFQLAKSLFEIHFTDKEVALFQTLLIKYVKVVETP